VLLNSVDATLSWIEKQSAKISIHMIYGATKKQAFFHLMSGYITAVLVSSLIGSTVAILCFSFLAQLGYPMLNSFDHLLGVVLFSIALSLCVGFTVLLFLLRSYKKSGSVAFVLRNMA